MAEEKEVFKAEFDTDPGNLKEVIGIMEDVAKAAKDAIAGLKLLQKIDLKTLQVNLDTGQVKKQAAEVDKTLTDLKKKFKDEPIQGPLPVDRKVFGLDELVGQFERVGATAETTNRGLGTMFRDVSDGLALIRGGGNSFVGLQQAMFGVTGAGGTLGKVFGFLSRNTDEVGIANERLAQAGVRASAQMSQLSSTLVAQTKILKDVAASELGLSKSQFNAIDQQIQRVEKAYKDMQTTIESGGRATPQQLSRIKVETQNLEQAFIELKAQGIIPAGTSTDDLINKLTQSSAKGRNAAQILVQQYHAMADAAKKAEEQQAKGGKAVEKQESFFRRLIPTFGLFSRGARDSANAIGEVGAASSKTGSALDGLDKEVKETGSGFLNLKNVIAGSLIGGTAIAGISFLKDQLASIATAFYEPNKAVQDFRITMANMMKGTGLDVDETQARIESFIGDVVAKTPFELTDAFESFQKLLISGFDPQVWLVPVADAAAAVNKPMEQLIGAMAKIQVGAKGAGIDMLRDFGIPVNQVGSFVDTATGRILNQDEVLNDTRNLYKLNAQELDKLGISFNRLAFDKQGSLINSSADALNILNGYLQQNATFAGAAEGRSRSLGGVISNLKDFVTNLAIVAGQPIFERLTTAGQLLLDKLTFIQPFLNSIATILGQKVTSALDFVIASFQNFNFSLENLPVGLQNLIATIDALIAGDWNSAWGFFLTTVDSAMGSVVDTISYYIDQAFDWGASLGSQLAEGIFEAASTVLTEALNFIGDTIASFLAPGSPPEEGPLSTIDKWGRPLGELYSNSLAQGIRPEPVVSSLSTLADSMSGQSGPLSRLLEERERLLERLRRADELGLDTTFLQQQLQNTQTQIDQMVAQAGQGAQELDEALKPVGGTKGQTPGRGGGGREGAGPRQGRTAETFQEKFEKEKTALEERRKAGLISQSEYLNEMLKLEKDFVKKSQEEGLTAGLEEHLKAVETLEKEVTIAQQTELEARFNAGLISEEEFTKELLKIKEKRAEDDLALGRKVTDEQLAEIKRLQDAVEASKSKGKGAPGVGGETGLIPTAGDILSGFGTGADTSLTTIASEATTKFVDTLRETTKTKFADFKTDLREQFASLGEDISAGLSKIGLSPELLALGAVVGGVTALLLGFGSAVLYLIPLVGLVALAILNWDTISQGLRDTYDFLNGVIDTFISNLGGQEEAQKNFNILLEDSDSIAGQFGKTIQKAFGQAFSGDFSGATDTLGRIFTEIDISRFTTTLQQIGTAISNTIWSMLPITLQTQLTDLKTAFNNLFAQGSLGGELFNLFTALQGLANELLPLFIGNIKILAAGVGLFIGGVIAIVTNLVIAFTDALPFIAGAIAGILRVITGFVEVFTGIVQLVKAGWTLISSGPLTFTEGLKILAPAMESLRNGFIDVFAGLIHIVTNAGLAIIAFVNSFFIGLIATVLSYVPGFQLAGERLFAWKDLVLQGLTSLQNQATEILFSLVDQIKAIFLGLYNYLVGESIIPDLISEAVVLFETWKTLLPTIVQEVVDTIIETFNSTLEKIKAVGRNIMEGLVKGMENAKGLVLEFIKSLITDDIIGSIKAKLGIQSPSVVMADLGEDTMKGYLQGMEGEAPSFGKFISKQVKEITKAFFPIVGGNKAIHKIFSREWRRFNEPVNEALSELAAQGNLTAETMEETIERITGRQLFGHAAESIRAAAPGFIAEFKKLREESLRAFHAQEIERGLGVLDNAVKIFDAFEKKMQEIRGTAFQTRNIVENMVGKDVSPEELERMAQAIIDAGGAENDQDKAILDAFQAQEKFNGALEQQQRIQAEMAKLEEQRAQLQLIRDQLDLIKQAEEAGVGQDIIAGLQFGLDQPLDEVLRSMGAITQAIIDKAREDLEIASPSRKFFGFGEEITKGLGLGIENTAGFAEASLKNAIDNIISLPANLNVSRAADFSTPTTPNQVFNSQQNQITNNINDRLDLALIQRKQEEMFAGAFR